MRAITIKEFGGPQVLTQEELPDPRPGPGQLTIDTTHAAVGLVDVFFRRGDLAGRAGLPQPPFVPGLEAAGTVRELGEGVSGFAIGEPVVTLSQVGLGGYASVTLADAAVTVSLEGMDVDPAQAVAALPNAVTAHLALTRVAHLRAGESVLIHGVAGGLAATFVAMARSLGASRVLGTVSSPARVADTAHLRLDEVFTSDRFVGDLTGRRVDVVVDPVGGDVRTASLDVLAPLGRILLVGHAARTPDTPVTGDELWHRNAGLLGFEVGSILHAAPELARPSAQAAAALLANGELALRYDTLPLSEAAEAHRRLEAREVPGRLVLEV